MVGNENSGKPPNTPPSPELQGPVIAVPVDPPAPGDWSIGGAG